MSEPIFSSMELDAIGEIMNISMGSSATAVSNMLSAKVWITTPRVSMIKASELAYPTLEPAICVKITYIEGVSGSNLMVLKQSDVQLILAQLMGMPLEVDPSFTFDEISISAVCEVMNQMMGSSATALSDFLGRRIDISTPEAFLLNDNSLVESVNLDPDEEIVTIHFDLTVQDVINSEFISVMNLDLARTLVDQMMNSMNAEPEPAPAPAPAPTPTPVPTPSPAAAQPQPQPQQPAYAPPPADPYAQQGYPQQPYPPQPYPQMPPQGYAPYPAYPQQPQQAYYPPPNVQSAQFSPFGDPGQPLSGEQQTNLRLLMNVPLNVTVEIGRTVRKVKEILEFSQGTIIELERQAGAPVDVVVNGQLIAKGDVVVIDDNFAVRITEILKTRLLENLSGKS